MNNTENKFMHEGVWYVASNEILTHNCIGCAGDCNSSLCAQLPPCSDAVRKDGRDVIFVESDADNKGGEE